MSTLHNQAAAAIRDSEDTARARHAVAELDEARDDYIASDPHCSEALERAMRKRIEDAQAEVGKAMRGLLRCIDREAGAL